MSEKVGFYKDLLCYVFHTLLAVPQYAADHRKDSLLVFGQQLYVGPDFAGLRPPHQHSLFASSLFGGLGAFYAGNLNVWDVGHRFSVTFYPRC